MKNIIMVGLYVQYKYMYVTNFEYMVRLNILLVFCKVVALEMPLGCVVDVIRQGHNIYITICMPFIC